MCNVSGKLSVSLAWVKKEAAPTTELVLGERHPVTNATAHFCLFDWMHQNNCKIPIEVLRRISLVPQLRGVVNTQAMEQRNNSLKDDIYFLNKMSPPVHLFMVRLIMHLNNSRINKRHIAEQKGVVGLLKINQLGQVCQDYTGVSSSMEYKPGKDKVCLNWSYQNLFMVLES